MRRAACLALAMTVTALTGCAQPSTTSAGPPAVSSTSPGTSAAPLVPSETPQVVLHADGIGDIWFGTSKDAARQALVDLWSEPDSDEVEFCELHTTEDESPDRTWTWGDLQVSVRDSQRVSDGGVRLAGWSVVGPRTPPGVVPPFTVVPGVDSKTTLLRSVPDVHEDELVDRLGPGYYARGDLGWYVEESGLVSGAYVALAICD